MELVIQVARARLKYDPETDTYGAGFSISDDIGVVTVTDFHEYEAANPDDRYAHAVITAIGQAPSVSGEKEPAELPAVEASNVIEIPTKRPTTRRSKPKK